MSPAQKIFRTLTIALVTLLLYGSAALSQERRNLQSRPFLEKGSYVIDGSVASSITGGMFFRAQAGQHLSIILETEKGQKASFSLLVGSNATDKKESAYSDNALDVQRLSDVLRKTADYQVLIETKEENVRYKLKVRLE